MSCSQEVKYPAIRREVMSSLGELSDLNYQHQHWVGGLFPESSLFDAVHRLFDDTALSDDPEACLDEFLKSEQELTAIRAVMNALDQVLVKYGTGLKDVEYTLKPEWPEVVSLAQFALFTMGATQH